MKIPFYSPWITNQDKKAVSMALNQSWLTNGPNLKKFEEEICKFVGVKYAMGVGSATQGLHLCVKAFGIGSGDEVIVPTFTFAATANAVIYCGAKPIFADVDQDTFNISPKEIKKKLSSKTKAIIVVHYGGQACEMDEILNIAKKNNIKVVEDCAHALGAIYKEKKCGGIGDAGCFSFYPTKVITTGEGGMITTNLSNVGEKVKLLRSHGMSVQAKDREAKLQWKYDIVDLGYNYRMDEIRAALGISQFKRVKKINEIRIKIAKKYDTLLRKIKGITIPQRHKDRNHIYHLYTIKIEKDYQITREELFKKLSNKGIGTSVQYFPLHLMSFYKKKYNINSKKFPNANVLKDQVLCLPIFPQMTLKQIEYVTSQLQ